MANSISSEKATQSIKELNKTANYVNWWLFRSKGTVAEPWPTAEQLLEDPHVQQAIKEHNHNVLTHLSNLNNTQNK